jgi:hypothetical protein
MARYQGFNDMRAVADDVAPVQINPTIGMYQEGYGQALSSLGRDIAGIGIDVNRQKVANQATLQEQQARLASASFMAEDVRLHQLSTIENLQRESGIEFSPEQVQNLLSATADANLLTQGELQMGGSSILALRRAALFQQRLAENPMFAPELEKAFRVAGGQAVTQGLVGVIRDAEEEREATRQWFETQSLELGLNPTTPIGERAAYVMRHQSLLRDKAQVQAELEILKANDYADARTATFRMNRYQAGVLPEIQGIVNNTLTELANNDTLENRNAAISRLNAWYADAVANARGVFNVPGVSQTDVENSLSAAKMFVDDAVEVLSGGRDLTLAKNRFELAQQTSEQDVINRFGLGDLVAYNKILKSFPEELQATLAGAEFAVNAGNLVRSAGITLTNEATARAARAELTKAGPNQIVPFTEVNKGHLMGMASDPTVTDQQFNTGLINMFAGYAPENAQLFDSMLPNLTQPEVLARLNRGLDASATAELTESMSRYLQDISVSTYARLQNTLTPAGITSTVVPNEPGQYPAPAGARRRISFNLNLDPYIETSYTASGMPSFRITGDVPPEMRGKVASAVRDLNTVGTKVGNVVKVAQALGQYKQYSPQELGQFITENGMLPGRAEAEQRLQNPTAPMRSASVDDLEVVSIEDLF